jgi:uncharacterized membrane protein
MINVTLYYRQTEAESQQAIEDLRGLSERFPHNLILVDIDTDSDLETRFEGKTPIVRIGPYTLQKGFTRQELEVALGAARDRAGRLEKEADSGYKQRVERGKSFSAADRFVYWFSHHYLGLFNLILFLYVGLPFAAPLLMKEGAVGPARAIYTIYSPLCHQLAFRSWFLFGEQAYYPRSLANISGVTSYEAMMGLSLSTDEKTDTFIFDARNFVGNDQVGYKVALCERDVAMYGALMLFGLIFALSGKKLKSVKWYLWLAIGMVPIALDGFSQLPSLLVGLPEIINRESTPFLRTLTGALFGLMTAWYLYPLIEASMKETRSMFAYKKVAVNQLQDKV